MLDGICVPTAGLVQQFLQGTTVVERLLNLRHELVWNVDANASPFDPAIEHVAGVLVTPRTRVAVVAHAGAPPKTQGPECGGPEPGGLGTEPAFHVGWRFTLGVTER